MLIVLAGVAAFSLASPPPAHSALGTRTPHLVVVMLENKEYGAVVGNPNAPYLNSTLIPSGRLFTSYYAVTHPSLPGYLVLSSGRYGGCVTDSCPRNADPAENLLHQMTHAPEPIGWKVYAESMPFNCDRANSGAYVVRHNPAVYYSNLGPGGDNTCATRDVPYGQLAGDVQAGALPEYAVIVPDQYDDMHTDRNQPSCQLGSSLQNEICQGDKWLQANVPALLDDGGRKDVTVIVTFDEGATTQGGGGKVMTLQLGPTTCTGCSETLPFDHYGLFTAIQRWFGLPELHPDAPSL